jgi:penicillin amidase
VRRSAAAALATVVLGCAAVAIWARSSRPTLEGATTLAALEAPVTVTRDAAGVPRVRAQSLADAVAALGFLHAQDRRLQMETAWRTAAGRLSEIAGPGALPSDRWMRTLRLADVAAREVAMLSDGELRLHEAYAAGVNAAGAGGQGLPFALVRRQGPLEPWTPLHSVLVAKLLDWSLASARHEEVLAAVLLREVGPERLSDFLPDYDGRSAVAPVATAGAQVSPLASRIDWSRLASHAFGPLSGVATFSGATGSNAWVVSGLHSVSGKPLLANDTHLLLTLPALWYAARLSVGREGEWAGATLPGLPGVITGQNGWSAWAVTSVGADQQDLFVEEIHDGTPPTARGPAGPETVHVYREEIRVRGGTAEPIDVRWTARGPLISDVDPALRKTLAHLAAAPDREFGVSLAWTGFEPAPPNRFLGLATARDFPSFRDALRGHSGPALNFLYADARGTIAYQMAGNIPIRAGGAERTPGLAWDPRRAWLGRIPFEELPSAVDPAEGILVSANARVTGPGYPHHISFDWGSPPDRQARIRNLLLARRVHSVETLKAIQLDTFQSDIAAVARWLHEAGSTDPDTKHVEELLDGWDQRATPDSVAALLAETIRLELAEGVFATLLPEDAARLYAKHPFSRFRALARAMDDPAARMFGPDPAQARALRASSVAEAEAKALERLRGSLGSDSGRWSWGRLHTVTFRHPLAALFTQRGLPAPGRLSCGPFAVPGSLLSINTTLWSAERPFAATAGATWRQVIDLGDPARSSISVPTPGQSEDPLSIHFCDRIAPWIEGDYRPLAPAAESDAGGLALVLELRPR